MKNQIDIVFENCKKIEKTALVIFVELGYPTLDESVKSIEIAIENGAEIIELGVPFSDPIADGSVISYAAQVAVANNTTLKDVLKVAETLKKKYPHVAFVLFSYMNIMYKYGIDKLCAKLKEIGIDGLLGVDIVFEEQAELLEPCQKHGIHLINLITPTTSVERLEKIATNSTGFIYYVSVSGVTGTRNELSSDLNERLELVKSFTSTPIALGFGISNGEMANKFKKFADAIIVGSAYVKLADDTQKRIDLIHDLNKNLKMSPTT